MKALILNGVPQGDLLAEKLCATLEGELKVRNYEGNLLNLADIEISPCLGCFGCWVKTPGVCVIDDAGRNVARAYMQSEMSVFITPVTFGGYSFQLKKAIDRLIPNLSPYFRKVGREIHHQMRYRRYPSSLILGILPEPDQEKENLFKTLAKRNSLNYEHPAWAVGVLYETQSDEEIREEIKALVEKVGGLQ